MNKTGNASSAKTRGDGGYIPPINLIASSPIIWLWSAFERWMNFDHLFLLVFTWFRKQKLFECQWRPFFYFLVFTWFAQKRVERLSYFIHAKKKWLSFILPMFKIEQNWDKIANYPPNAQHKSAPLGKAWEFVTFTGITFSRLRQLYLIHFCHHCNNRLFLVVWQKNDRFGIKFLALIINTAVVYVSLVPSSFLMMLIFRTNKRQISSLSKFS